MQEYMTSREHLCDFYSIFHCKLNFIVQCWGVVKWFHSSIETTDIGQMEKNVIAHLEDISFLQIQWYVVTPFTTEFITQVCKPVCKVFLSICTDSNGTRNSLSLTAITNFLHQW